MDIRRVTEWLGTAEGLGKGISAILGILGAIWLAASTFFDSIVRELALPQWMPREWMPRVAAALVIAAFAWLCWRSYVRFATASRVEQPDFFTLHPTDPMSLIGRKEDLASLTTTVKRNRLVLLDGESGCGKSALVASGLVPQLRGQPDGLLPLVVADWGDDWVRGPLSATLDALFHCVSQTDRERLRWDSPPDLAANVSSLVTALDARLRTIVDTLGRRPLLIADQFDDYQALYLRRFLDDDANWLTPAALAEANPFWDLARTQLTEGRLHLLIVSRADTAAGLSCVRFLPESQTATRTLSRIEVEYLRPLLAGIAPDSGPMMVVSNPDRGWHDLRERLVRDLNAEGAVLMQQVRTVLLGLRQLVVLTPKCYRAAGGLRGMETLVISRALRRASESIGGGQRALRSARAVLASLVLRDNAGQLPKARRRPLSVLDEIVGHRPEETQSILQALRDDEVVRPVVAVGEAIAWQLDHDYLARAVVAEARLADRWTAVLFAGKARYDEAIGDWRQRWAALLPTRTLMRLCWERALGHLTFGAAARYAWMSAARLAVIATCLTAMGAAAYAWDQDRKLTVEATRLIDRFGGSDEKEAVLEIWRAPERLRRRVHDVVFAAESRLERAMRSAWPMADSGLETARVREAANAARTLLERGTTDHAHVLKVYGALTARLSDPADVRIAAAVLRSYLEQATANSGLVNSYYAETYAKVVAWLSDPAVVRTETAALRLRLEQENNPDVAGDVARAYAAVAARLSDPTDVRTAVATLRSRLDQEVDRSRRVPDSAFRIDPYKFAEAYATVVTRLSDPTDVRTEAAALRSRLKQEQYSSYAGHLAPPYAAVVTRLGDPVEMRLALASLRPRLVMTDFLGGLGVAQAYAVVVMRQSDPADVRTEAAAVRALLGQATTSGVGATLARAWAAAVTTRLSDPAHARPAAAGLRAILEQETNPMAASVFAHAYARVTAWLNDPADVRAAAAMLRARLEQANAFTADDFVQAYGAVAGQLSNPEDARAEAAALRARLEQTTGGYAYVFAQAYAAVVARMNEAAELETAAALLRSHLEHETDSFPADHLAKAYAVVLRAMIERTDLAARSVLVSQTLTMAGHPFLSDVSPLLAALQPASGSHFDGNAGAAVRWAEQTYGIKPVQLRPSPLPR